MVGVVGDVDRMQGDAISDHLNLGSWLEGLTKFYDASIVISSATHQNDRGLRRSQTDCVGVFLVVKHAECFLIFTSRPAPQSDFVQAIVLVDIRSANLAVPFPQSVKLTSNACAPREEARPSV